MAIWLILLTFLIVVVIVLVIILYVKVYGTKSDIIQAPTISPITGVVQYFGDSITAGIGASALSKRWTSVLSSLLNVTESNYGTSGQEWADCHTTIYGTNFARGGINVISYGTNDMIHGQTDLQQISNKIRNCLLYTILPSSCFIDLTSTTVTQTGQWVASMFSPSKGIQTSTLDGSAKIQFQIKGRYIAFASSQVTGWSNNNYIMQNLTVDGSTTSTKLINTMAVSALSIAYNPQFVLYDTGAQSENSLHTVSISASLVGTSPISSPNYHIDWVAGFDSGVSGSSMTFVGEFGSWDNNLYTVADQRLTESLRSVTAQICNQFKNEFGLPVYYFSGLYNREPNGSAGDGLHPHDAGHAQIANRFLGMYKALRG